MRRSPQRWLVASAALTAVITATLAVGSPAFAAGGSRPNEPDRLSVPGAVQQSGWSYSSTLTPRINVLVDDPDGDSMNVEFQALDPSGVVAGTCNDNGVPNYVTASCVMSKLADDTDYVIRARASDSVGPGPWTLDTVRIRTSVANPLPPVITCVNSPNGSWVAAPPASAVSCRINLSTGTGYATGSKLYYSWDDGEIQAVTLSSEATYSPAFSVSNTVGTHSILAWADPGNGAPTLVAQPYSFAFGAAAATINCPQGPADGNWWVNAPTADVSCSVQIPAYSGASVVIDSDAGPLGTVQTGTTAKTVAAALPATAGEHWIQATLTTSQGVVIERTYRAGYGNWASTSSIMVPGAGERINPKAILTINSAVGYSWPIDAQFKYAIASTADGFSTPVYESGWNGNQIAIPAGILSSGSVYYWRAEVRGSARFVGAGQAKLTSPVVAFTADSAAEESDATFYASLLQATKPVFNSATAPSAGANARAAVAAAPVYAPCVIYPQNIHLRSSRTYVGVKPKTTCTSPAMIRHYTQFYVWQIWHWTAVGAKEVRSSNAPTKSYQPLNVERGCAGTKLTTWTAFTDAQITWRNTVYYARVGHAETTINCGGW